MGVSCDLKALRALFPMTKAVKGNATVPEPIKITTTKEMILMNSGLLGS